MALYGAFITVFVASRRPPASAAPPGFPMSIDGPHAEK